MSSWINTILRGSGQMVMKYVGTGGESATQPDPIPFVPAYNVPIL